MRARDLQLPTFRLQQDGVVLVARHVNPPLNFVAPASVRDLERLTRAVDRDSSVSAVVLTGGVERRFMTHADPDALGALTGLGLPPVPAPVLYAVWRVANAAMRLPGLAGLLERRAGALGVLLAWGHRWRSATLRMNRSRAVYVAAIDGPALGGGLEIALACDIRVAADAEHVTLGQIETLAGLIPGGGGTQRLPRLIGTAAALSHILEGAPLPVRDAERAGLVHQVLPESELISGALALARRLAARGHDTVRAAKQAVHGATDTSLPHGLHRELALFAHLGTQPRAKAAYAAFREDLAELGDSPFVARPQPWVDERSRP